MYKIIFSSLLAVQVLCSSLSANAQIITTLAGKGVWGYGGDGDLATYCKMQVPLSMAHDKRGNLYFCDSKNHRVRVINAFGIVTTFAGIGSLGMSGDGGPADQARLNEPSGVAVDKDNNVYIADTKNNRIRKVDNSGVITTIVGNGVKGFKGDGAAALAAQISEPCYLMVDDNYDLYFSDNGNNRVRKVNASGTISTVVGTGMANFCGDGGPATAACINNPMGLAKDSYGNLYVADNGSQRIRKVDTAGIITTVAGDSKASFGGDHGQPFTSQLHSPQGIAIDRDNNLFIADVANQRVRMLDPSGIISTVAGKGAPGHTGDGGDAQNALLNLPRCVATDSAGNVYVGEGSYYIRFIHMKKIVGDDKMWVFPNPCYRETTILMPSEYEELAEVRVFNTAGEMVSHVTAPTNKYVLVHFDVPGTYIVSGVSPHKSWYGKVTVFQ